MDKTATGNHLTNTSEPDTGSDSRKERVTAHGRILDRSSEIDDEQFEQLCKMLIERAEQTRSDQRCGYLR